VSTEGGSLRGPVAYTAALARRHARKMDFTDRSLRGYVYIASEGLRILRAVPSWVERGVTFARSLPPKSSTPSPVTRGTAWRPTPIQSIQATSVETWIDR